jgi:hypothetical protein
MTTLPTIDPVDATLEAVERYAPDIDVPPPAVLDQARRNLELRSALLLEFGAIEAAELAELAGSEAKNPAVTVDNWKRADRIVAVRWRGRSVVPGFQLLTDGHPDPLVRPVLRRLRDQGFGPWEQALWWVVPAGALGGDRPVDRLLAARDADDAARTATGAELVAADDRPRDWF